MELPVTVGIDGSEAGLAAADWAAARRCCAAARCASCTRCR